MPLPPEILNTLPEDVRGSEHIASYNDVGSLVKDLITVKTSDWRTGLPDDLKADPSLSGFKAIPELAKSFVETKKLVGQSLRAPAADAPDEEWEKFYKAGGRPNAPEEYKLAFPDEFKITPEEKKEIEQTAYRLGLNGRQAQRLVDIQAQGIADMKKADRDLIASTEKEYREKWGPNYDRKVALIKATLDKISPDKSLSRFFEASGLAVHPALIELILDKGARLKEDNPMFGDVAGTTTREEALKRLAEIDNDPKHPYHKSKSGDPIFEEVWGLRQIAYD